MRTGLWVGAIGFGGVFLVCLMGCYQKFKSCSILSNGLWESRYTPVIEN